MTTTITDTATRALGSDLRRRVFAPLAGLVIALMLAVLALVFLAAREQDRLDIRASVRLARTAIETKQKALATTITDYAWWDEAVEKLHLRFDRAFAGTNFGTALHETYGLDMSFVVGPDDRTAFAIIGDEPGPHDALEVVGWGLPRLLARARATPTDRVDPIVEMLSFENGTASVAVVAVAALTPATHRFGLPAGPRSVLVWIDFIDPVFLAAVSANYRLPALRVARSPADRTAAVLPLVSASGVEVGALTWRPDHTGRAMLRAVLPPLSLGFAAFGVLVCVGFGHARRSASALAASEARFRSIVDSASEAVVAVDAAGHVVLWNAGARAIFGHEEGEILGRPVDLIIPASMRAAHDAAMRRRGAGDPARLAGKTLELQGLRKDGGEFPIEISLSSWHEAGRPMHGAVIRDIGERKRTEAQIAHLALHDALTGLPNRVLLGERLERALAEARRQSGRVAVLCLDLDRFKEVNDTLGHGVGDALLRAVSVRLRAGVRETDTVARLGGDEFCIVQTDLDQPDGASALCRRLLEAFATSFALGEHEAFAGLSVGVAVGGEGDDPEALLRHADTALYRAKADGRNAFRFFEPGMDARLRARGAIERGLRKALARGEFELAYQPLVEAGGGRTVGVEALLRWRHPERGLLAPAEFVPIAEETGLILPIGEWVLRAACARAAAWPGLFLSVNLSAVQFRRGNLVDTVARALAETGLAPERLELEITESVLLQDTAAATAILRSLKALGVSVAVDDFGTGYSSLSYLQKFAFDKIKIDQSFVRRLETSTDAAAIVRAVLGLGRSLGMTTNAEGIETKAQADFLSAEGCDQLQGFYFGRPVAATVIDRMVVPETLAG